VLRVKSALAVAETPSSQTSAPPPDSVESAKAAGLRYVTDDSPGYERWRRGRGFVYTAADGKIIRDGQELQRIRSLVIPPAWRVEAVAKQLGNTKAVCRNCYIHPAILDAYGDGSLFKITARGLKKPAATEADGLTSEEATVLALLERSSKALRRRPKRTGLRGRLRISLAKGF
jgi:DNA topoisomerase-1